MKLTDLELINIHRELKIIILSFSPSSYNVDIREERLRNILNKLNISIFFKFLQQRFQHSQRS